mmetsp:Transcript_91612/g.258166  ORF Transcript_91612/g.258166 Transcript_91612/m.258166 type:complete len:126 (-) Transcript_91612:69-446(-)
MLPKGQVSIMFQDDVTQVIPKGWLEAMATRWSGQREKLVQDEDPTGSASDTITKTRQRPGPITGPTSGAPDCVICMDAKPNGVIVHGETCHQSTCFSCAKRLHRNGDTCPICREPIDTVCRLHGE